MALVFMVDFAYYAGHRGAHHINLFWSGHQAHHSSEEYNLSTALRQGGLETLFASFFKYYIVLFIDYDAMRTLFEINAVYQFWVHTAAVRKFPWLIEFLMTTPSHHRVHHARNPLYLDKNYGGMFIIWDRIFGTFEEEKEECVYGLVHPLQTFNPIYVQFHHIWRVLTMTLSASSWNDKFQIMFYGPGWDVANKKMHDIPNVEPKKEKKFDPLIDRWLKYWAGLNFFIFIIPFIILFSKEAVRISVGQYILGSVVCAANMSVIAYVLEGKIFGNALIVIDLTRIAVTALFLSQYLSLAQLAILSSVSVAFTLWFVVVQHGKKLRKTKGA